MMISVIAPTRVYIRLLTHDAGRSGSGGYTNNTTSLNARNEQNSANVPTFPAAPGFDQPYGLATIKKSVLFYSPRYPFILHFFHIRFKPCLKGPVISVTFND
jgi:hypothetical protein